MTTESHLQGCDTQSAVRHDGVLFKGTTKTGVRVVDPNGHNMKMLKSEERGRRPSGTQRSEAPGRRETIKTFPFPKPCRAWRGAVEVRMFGYKGNHGTGPKFGYGERVINNRSFNEGWVLAEMEEDGMKAS